MPTLKPGTQQLLSRLASPRHADRTKKRTRRHAEPEPTTPRTTLLRKVPGGPEKGQERYPDWEHDQKTSDEVGGIYQPLDTFFPRSIATNFAFSYKKMAITRADDAAVTINDITEDEYWRLHDAQPPERIKKVPPTRTENLGQLKW